MSLVPFLHIKRKSADFEKMAEGNQLLGTEMAEVIFREGSDGEGGDIATNDLFGYTRGSLQGKRGADVM